MKEKGICTIRLDDELKKIYLCISELENGRNFDDLTEKIFAYIISVDLDKKSDVSKILKEASSWTKYKNKSLEGELPSHISIDIELINKVREIFKRVFYENKIIQIPWMLKYCAKAYALNLSMSLEKFVYICNNYKEPFLEDNGSDLEAKKLADVFTGSCSCPDKKLENVCVCLKLKKIIDEDGQYTFQQNNSIVAEIDVRNPYLENNILNQKWHVLIALLAFLDIASFEKDCKECAVLKKWNIGKIKEIKIRRCEKK